ncbi:MAG: cation transporting ATPase C-terminal domain-containing protein, partial [Clostridia bacterium]|nr:cation transporting ATPase C-terminal domain-containing protein [Clostridia bacterium]
MLWINLITDSLPALALGMEKGEPDSMKRPPRDPKKGIFSDGVGGDIAYQGVFVAILTLAAYFIGHFMEIGKFELTDSPHGMTMAFLTMSMAEIFQAFNMRSQKRSIFTLGTSNGFLWGSAAVAFVLTASVIFVPGLAKLFSFETIDLKEFAVAFALALAIIPLVELVKLIKRKIAKNKEN